MKTLADLMGGQEPTEVRANGERHYPCPKCGDGSLNFAHDIADGLLDDIAAWLEKRNAETRDENETLQAAQAHQFGE